MSRCPEFLSSWNLQISLLPTVLFQNICFNNLIKPKKELLQIDATLGVRRSNWWYWTKRSFSVIFVSQFIFRFTPYRKIKMFIFEIVLEILILLHDALGVVTYQLPTNHLKLPVINAFIHSKKGKHKQLYASLITWSV